jgi:hydroxymethylglutaryl-CoA lyase
VEILALPEKVILNECWARDGLQNQEKFIETADKLTMLRKIVDAGFTRIEATSFSHPKYVPQFQDSMELLSQLKNVEGVTFKSTCVNQKALLRAIEAKNLGYPVNEVSFVMAASEEYNRVNVKMDNATLLKTIDLAQDEGLANILVSVSTAFGCSIQGKVEEDDVLKLVEHFLNKKVYRMSISDTTGIGHPEQSFNQFSRLKKAFPEATFIAHFHDTRGWGIANNYAALEAGITHFDVSLGGIGGPPAQRLKAKEGNTGNVCTEDFVLMLHGMGVETGIDIEKLIDAGKYSEQLLGSQRSQTLRMY